MWYNQAADPDQHSFSLLDPDTDQHYGMRIRIQEKKTPKKSMEIIEKREKKNWKWEQKRNCRCYQLLRILFKVIFYNFYKSVHNLIRIWIRICIEKNSWIWILTPEYNCQIKLYNTFLPRIVIPGRYLLKKVVSISFFFNEDHVSLEGSGTGFKLPKTLIRNPG